MPISDTSSSTSSNAGSLEELRVSLSKKLDFNEEMDRLWIDCEILARNASMLVKPLHISLMLIFGRIHDTGDPRLYNSKPELPKSLELPLFWTTITQAASIEGTDVATYLNLVRKKIKGDTRHLPQIIGQAMWDEVDKGRFEANLVPEGPDVESRADTATKAIFSRAREISSEHSSDFVAPQHVLLALLEECADIKAILKKYLKENVKKLSGIVQDLRPMTILRHDKPPLFPELNKWADDLTEDVKKKKDEGALIHPLICRNTELRRLINVLSRHKKNSAVLLGDPGVGKTAIAEGLALRLIEGNLKVDAGGESSVGVPEGVVARVFNLNLASILASTACKSAYEQIVKMILDEVVQHEERGIRAILFMDNLGQISIGGYRGDGTGLDAATIMKPFLMKGKIRVVGCSTLEDFRIYIEKDGALARQFSPIQVCESTPEQTVEILRGMKPTLEHHHRVQIQDKALVSATNIAIRYFAHKRLPDAAIDLIDETCASAVLARNADSEAVWKLQRKRVILEMDIRSLRRDINEGSDKKLMGAENKLRMLDDRIQNWRSSGRVTRNLERKLKETREKLRKDEDRLVVGEFKSAKDREITFVAVEKLHSEIEDLQDKLEMHRSGMWNMGEVENERKLEAISPLMVSKVASYYTFIPPAVNDHNNTTRNDAPIAATVTPTDSSDILNLTNRLNNVVIGQEEAIQVVTSAIQCLWVGFKNPRKPIASFLFAGPSGSGKTLLVKELGNIALRQAGTLLRIDANDYAKPHSMTRLVGTPSCTGYDNGGQLTECVKRKPFSIVHIKDIEKGCVEFRMVMQTILDEGTLRDGDGNIVDFTNCMVVISTSVGQMNLRASVTEEQEAIHFKREVERVFPGEFLSRIDQIMIFRRMTSANLIKMIDARLEELKKQLALVDLQFRVDKATSGYIQAQVARDRVGSARKIERIIRTEILTPLARLLLENDVPKNRAVVLNVERSSGGAWKLSPRLSEREREVEPVAEQKAPESPVPSSPATSYYSLDSTQSYNVSLADSASVDHEDHCQSYSWPPSLQRAHPPVLCPFPERVYY